MLIHACVLSTGQILSTHDLVCALWQGQTLDGCLSCQTAAFTLALVFVIFRGSFTWPRGDYPITRMHDRGCR